MKLRKLFAGIAAAATMLGGLALGATTANAAETPVNNAATVTFTAAKEEQLTGAKLSAYKIADYVNYGTAENPVYGVKTAANADRAKLKTALKAAGFTGVDGLSDDTDLMAWAMGQTKDNPAGQVQFDQSAGRPWQDPSVTRKFADALKASNAFTATADSFELNAPTGDDTNGWSATNKTALTAGVYLFLDGNASTDTLTQAVPMIVSTGSVNNGVLSLGDNTATVNMKNTVSGTQTKSTTAQSASVGESVPFELGYTIPNPVPTGFTLQFNDVPSKGLTVDLSSLVVKANGAQLTLNTDYTVTNNLTENKGDGISTFVVKITDPSKYVGQKITVNYNATVNDEAETVPDTNYDKVTNKLVDNNGTPIPGTDTLTKIFGFQFKKVNAQNEAVQGAKFTLSVAEGQDGMLPTPAASYTDITSDVNGVVKFDGLKAGSYTVTETSVAPGYQDFKASFTVTIDNSGTVTFAGTDAWGLAPKDNAADYQVKNVKSVTQLPLTGAAGIALFVVLAGLLAGAAVTVYTKSRSTKRALNA